VVIIATHNRLIITTKNIELLQQQRCKIVLVVSYKEEFNYYSNRFPEIEIVRAQNDPLGAKWQAGVNWAVTIGANPLIIVGSDDILGKDYINRALDLMVKGYDLIGTTSWYTYESETNSLYKMKYINQNAHFPIGSGKVFSKSLLEKINNQVFDVKANRKLDDLGYHNTMKAKAPIVLDDDLNVLAVKGQWNEMNSLKDYLRSRNIKSEPADTEILKELFNYE